jgi:hypothetical protein
VYFVKGSLVICMGYGCYDMVMMNMALWEWKILINMDINPLR